MIETSAILKEQYTDYFVIPENQFFLNEKLEETLVYTDIELVITDFVTGKPIPNAMISIDSINRTAVCNAEGKAVLQEVITGEFIIDVIVWGYIANSTKVRFSSRNVNTVQIKMIRNS